MLFAALLVAAIVGLDQLVKYWAVHTLAAIGTMPLIQDVFHLTYVENRGAAFGILQDKRWLFVVLTAVMAVVLCYLMASGMVKHPLGRVGLLFVLGGAVGNCADRLFRGFVVDLFDFRLINFAVFNVADIFIVVGGLVCMVYFLFVDPKLHQDKGPAAPEGDRHAP